MTVPTPAAMSELPRISIRLDGHIAPQRAVELAALAEAERFAAVWFAENAFERSAIPAAAATAYATTRIGIGLGVVNPYSRHPALIAMEAGALDELTSGRLMLGIGSGVAAAVERMGLAADRPLAAVRDAVSIIRGMLAGETVRYGGRMFQAKEVALGYRPPRPDLPILMAARGEKALQLCGEIADGLMLSNLCARAFTSDAVARVRAAAGAAGRPAPQAVVQYVPCVAASDREVARRAAKRELGALVRNFWSLGERVLSAKAAMLASGIPEAEIAAAAVRLRADEPAERALDERFVDAFAIAGTAAECLAAAAAYRAAGVTELALSFVGDDPAADIAYLGAALAGRTK